MGLINDLIEALFKGLENGVKARYRKSKYRIGEQIYFMRYDIIHCGFINHITLDVDQQTFTYETDLVDVLAESDTDDFVNLTVYEENACATLEELIEKLKENMVISQFL